MPMVMLVLALACAFAYADPVVDGSKQGSVLAYYIQQIIGSALPQASLLTVCGIHDIISHLPDTAPGIGGVPYAAWRVDALLFAMIYRVYLVNLATGPGSVIRSTPERVQLKVYIGKKKTIIAS